MTPVQLGLLVTVALAFLPTAGALIKLYGDIRVLKEQEKQDKEYIKESEMARGEVVTAVAEMKNDIGYIKEDIKSNKEFRKVIYKHLLNENSIKKQA